MGRSRFVIGGQPTTGGESWAIAQPAQPSAPVSGGTWQCQVCRSVRVNQRAVFSAHSAATLHRIICEACGTVGHYDTPSRDGITPLTTHNRKFRLMD